MTGEQDWSRLVLDHMNGKYTLHEMLQVAYDLGFDDGFAYCDQGGER